VREYQQLQANLLIASELAIGVGTPYSAQVLESIWVQDFPKLFAAKVDPAEYDDPHAFSGDYAVSCFLRKVEIKGDVKKLHDEAIARFKAREVKNSLVNSAFKSRLPIMGVEGIISDAKRKIAEILGEFDMREFVEGCGWGPGATSTLKSKWCTVDRKILEPRLSVTPRALRYARAYHEHAYAWSKARFHLDVGGPCSWLKGEYILTGGERFATVVKDALSRRTIGIQPTMNLFFQKGIGRMIRRRLKRCGIDLDSQERNQVLAMMAYLDGLATVDLREASNSVITEVVRELTPPEWFRRMDDLRCHQIDIDGKPHTLQLFGAMGNGFTFELETLIFYALCWAIVRCEAGDSSSPIAVYGDDIVVSSQHFERLSQVFPKFGFEINDQKSFHSGPFYESCGKHYFKSVDVTPLYQKELITDAPSSIRCANRIFRWAHRMGINIELDGRGYQAYSLARRLASDYHGDKTPLPLQPWWLEGDGAICVSTASRRFHFDRDGIARIPVYRTSQAWRQTRNEAMYAEALRSPAPYLADFYESEVDPMEFAVWFEPGLTKASYGRVTPRGIARYTIGMRRIYRQHTSGLQWLFSNQE
jgi:hypothetical protein